VDQCGERTYPSGEKEIFTTPEARRVTMENFGKLPNSVNVRSSPDRTHEYHDWFIYVPLCVSDGIGLSACVMTIMLGSQSMDWIDCCSFRTLMSSLTRLRNYVGSLRHFSSMALSLITKFPVDSLATISDRALRRRMKLRRVLKNAWFE